MKGLGSSILAFVPLDKTKIQNEKEETLWKKLFDLNSLIPEGRTLGLAQSAEVPGLLPGQPRHVTLDLGRGHQQDVALIRIGVIILHIVVSDV